MHQNDSATYMSQALQLAERGRFSVSPNPMVGCILVKDSEIIGQGFHVKAGSAHAEIIALQQAGQNAKDATAYITLEPCCHYGHTPPCTLALIKAGIKKVYIAIKDPNPLIAGKGIDELQKAGIEVEIGLFANEARQLNEAFFFYITHKRPFVIAKWAMSLDGKTVASSSDSRHISTLETQQSAHSIRHEVDAILVGSNTAIKDNPKLTVRLSETHKHPIRMIVSTEGHLPSDLIIFDKKLPAKTIVATTNKNHTLPAHIEVLLLPKNQSGQVDLLSLLNKLGELQITSLLVEGGMKLLESFFAENLVNKAHVYIAPVIIGSLKNKKPVNISSLQKINQDFHLVSEVLHV